MSERVKVEIRQLPHGEGLALPAYQSADAAGLDLLAAVAEDAPLVLLAGKHAMVPTGLAIALPGLEEQGDHQHGVGRAGGQRAEPGAHALPDPGMQDALETAPGVGIGEDPFAEPGAIQGAVGSDQVRAEGRRDLGQGRFAWLHHLPRDLVGVDHRDAAALETAADRRLAAADSAGEADDEHGAGLLCRVSLRCTRPTIALTNHRGAEAQRISIHGSET